MYRPSNGPGDRDYHRRRQALDGRGLSPLTISLLVQLWQQVERLPVKPVITIALLAMNIVPHVTYIDVVGYDLANISQVRLFCRSFEALWNQMYSPHFIFMIC